MQPGTVFYVDGTYGGTPAQPLTCSITVGTDATVDATQTCFTSACSTSMWLGVAFDANGGNEILTMNNCTVANAYYGVLLPPSNESSYYDIQKTLFQANLYDLYDVGFHYSSAMPLGTSIPCKLWDNNYFSSPNFMLPPYQYTGTLGDDWWTQEAMHITPQGDLYGSAEVSIAGKTRVEGHIYGLVANVPDQADIELDGELTMLRAVRAHIWLDETYPVISTSNINLYLNTAAVSTSNYYCRQTSKGDPMYGLVAAAHNQGTFLLNVFQIYGVMGSAGDSTVTGYRSQYGVVLGSAYKPVEGMVANYMTLGLSVGSGSTNHSRQYV